MTFQKTALGGGGAGAGAVGTLEKKDVGLLDFVFRVQICLLSVTAG